MQTHASIWFAVVIGLAVPVGAAGQSRPADDEVVAVLHGNAIRLNELNDYWRRTDPKSFQALNEQLRRLRERMLDGLIGERLLEREAARQRTTVGQLVGRRASAVPVVTDAEVRSLYERSSAPGQGVTLEMARPTVELYLRKQKEGESRQAYIDELRQASKKDISVSESYRESRRAN